MNRRSFLRLIGGASLLLLILMATKARAGTLVGVMQGPTGLPVKNATLTLTLNQAGLLVGTGNVAQLSASCYTDANGNLVGAPNPLVLPSLAANYGSGTVPGGIYYVVYTFLAAGGQSAISPEATIQMTGTGSIVIRPPTSIPAGVTGIDIYIGTSSGGETLQGTQGTTSVYTQGTPLVSGANPPASNSTICSIAFNDTIIPYTGYAASLISSSGNAYPGWPQSWQLNGGANGTINISQGAPLWNGVVVYPQPILSQPLNHGLQSISGNLDFGGYDILNVGNLTFEGGSTLLACPTNGPVNAKCGPYSARGDLQTTTGCGMALGSTTVSCPSAPFAATVDPGKTIYVAGAGVGGATLKSTIASVTSSTNAMLAAPASTAVANTPAIWATDDTTALQNAYNAAISQGRALYIPAGQYLHHGLNFTGVGNQAQTIIYGDGYTGTDLYAEDVTNPGSVISHTASIGVDLSVASQTDVHDIAFLGGFSGTAFEDIAPGVNVFCARQAQTGGNPLSVLHTWQNVYTESNGPYDVFWDGCEQTNMIDSHFQTDASNAVAALYLTNVNTPDFLSPYVPIIAPGGSVNTMTKLSVTGGRTSFVGYGNMVVLDEGAYNGIYQISFEDTYSYMQGPGHSGVCGFLADTAPNAGSYVRTVKLDHVYVEGSNDTTCPMVTMTGGAIQWDIRGTERYPTQLPTPNFQFNGGFLGSTFQANAQNIYNSGNPLLSAPTCRGSLMLLGGSFDQIVGCNDWAGAPPNGSNLRGYPITPYSAMQWVKLGTWVTNGIAGDVLHITYDSTGGQSSLAGQQGYNEIVATSGNTVAAPNLTGITAWSYGSSNALVVNGLVAAATGGSTATNNYSWDIYVHVQPYASGSYRVTISDGATWNNLQTAVSAAPTGAYVVPGMIFGNINTSTSTPTGTCTSNGYISTVINGTTVHIGTCI